MKKDIEWLKEEIEEDIKSWGGGNPDYFRGASDAYENVKDWLNQLDEPEVLSQEWIDENKSLINGRSTNPDGTEGECYDAHYIHVLELQNLLVPKQELPVIPKFVAEHIKNRKGESLAQAYNIPTLTKVGKWLLEKKNCETFARAWLDGYTVEKEQKYYVLNKELRPMLCKSAGMSKNIMESNTGFTINEKGLYKEQYQLTEQEIKDYDERYFAFAVPVEELEE